MATNTPRELSEFSRRALQRMKDKHIPRFEEAYLEDMDLKVRYRSLTDDEVAECYNLEDNGDPTRSDKYCVYLAMVEPDLRKTATELKNAGEITEYTDIMDMFTMREISELAVRVMTLSKAMGGSPVKSVEKLKNS